MATQVVQLTGDEADLLRAIDRMVRKQKEFEDRLKTTGEAGDLAGTEVAAAMNRIEREANKSLRGMLSELKSLGPEGSAAAAALQNHFVSAGKAGYRSLDDVLKRVRELDPTAAEAASSAAKDFVDSANRAENAYELVVAEMRAIGPEGRKAAEELRARFVESGKIVETSLGDVLAKVKQLDPAAAEAAAAVAKEFRESAQKGENAYEKLVAEIRSAGPEGKKAADAIRQQFVTAGKISEKSMADIVNGFDKIDPESKAAATAILANLKHGTSQSENLFTKLKNVATSELMAVGGAYLGVSQSIQVVNEMLEHQKKLLDDVNAAHLGVAPKHQDAFKNLVGFSAGQTKELIEKILPAIQKETGFPSMEGLIDAASAAGSSGATFDQLPDVVRESARVSKLKPEEIVSISQAALAIGKESEQGTKHNINLLMTTGGQAVVTDPRAVAERLPRAIRSTVINSGDNVAKEEAIAQGSALYAYMTEFGNDLQGQSSTTAVEKLVEFINAITRDSKQDPGDTFGRLKLISEDPKLRATFLEKVPSEAQFRGPIYKLLEQDSKYVKRLQEMRDSVRGGSTEFDKVVAQIESGTASSAIASSEARSKGNLQSLQLSDTEPLAAVRDKVASALENAPSNSFFSRLQSALLGESGFIKKYGGLGGSTAAEEAVSGIERLLEQIVDIRSTGGPERHINFLKAEIENLQKLIESSGQSLDPKGVEGGIGRLGNARRRAEGPRVDPRTGARYFHDETTRDEAIEIYRKMEETLRKIADTNEKIAKHSEKTEKNTEPQEEIPQPVTPALSTQAP